MGTDNGLSVYREDDDRFHTYTAAHGLSGKVVSAMAEDSAGNLWFTGQGAIKIARGGFVTYGEADGLVSLSVRSIFEDQKGELCILTHDRNEEGARVINRFDGRRFHPTRPNIPPGIHYWGWGWYQHVLQDHTGVWWVPTGEGLVQFPPLSEVAQLASARSRAVYTAQNGLAGSDVFRVFEDSRGDLWIATQSRKGDGLTRWERATGKVHRVIAEARNLASAFHEDRAGNLWIGFYSGALARYRQGRLEFLPGRAPAPSGHLIDGLYLDHTGRLWAAKRGAGLIRIDSPEAPEPKFTIYTTAEGLASNLVYSVTEDRWGRIYAGTARGVDCFYPATPLRIRHYTTADGLARGSAAPAFRDRHGTLWFGSGDGLSRFDPDPDQPERRPPVVITAVRVRGVERPISALGAGEISGVELAPDQNQIQVEFTGLDFRPGAALRYQYRVDGVDSDWSPPTDQRSQNFARLSAGDYRFLVRAVSAEGTVSAQPASLSFTILPPVWARWWFRAVAILLVAAIIYTLYRYRVARLLEVERLRTRIATDLHDDIGSTLSQIAILSEVAARGSPAPGSIQPLADIANRSRELVDCMSEIVWAIDPEQDHLTDLTYRMRQFATDLFTPAGIDLQFASPDDMHRDPELGADVRRQIFLIYKESLHNALRHSGCTAVDVAFRMEGNRLSLTVHDNGQGFDVERARRGHGLASMEQRARQIGGCLSIDSKPGCGATVRFEIPVHRRPSLRRLSILPKQVGTPWPFRRILKN